MSLSKAELIRLNYWGASGEPAPEIQAMKRRVNAREYAAEIGKSVTTARKRLDERVRAGTAVRIQTYSAWSHRGLGSGIASGTVPAIEYDLIEEQQK